MFELLALLVERWPERFAQHGRLSLARLQATRTVYLVFAERARSPICVVKVGRTEDLQHTHAALKRLRGYLPDAVPESIAVAGVGQGMAIHVQSALGGCPWFKLRQFLQSRRQSVSSLRKQAFELLNEFHGVVRRVGEWRRSAVPGVELTRQLHRFHANGFHISPDVRTGLDATIQSLEKVGPIDGWWQHGDFCVNNLLVDDAALRIIDFDDFGHNAMPMHDAFTLALSCSELERTAPPQGTVHEFLLECCCHMMDNTWSSALRNGLLYHCLLWQTNQCAANPGRSKKSTVLIRCLESVVRVPVF